MTSPTLIVAMTTMIPDYRLLLTTMRCWLIMLVSTSTIFMHSALMVVGESSPSCSDETIYSNSTSSKTGELTLAPNYLPNTHCIFQLIGRPNERVSISFIQFEVKGVLPRCQADYIDVYTQVREPFQNLLNVPLHGRYCGLDIDRLPKLLVSMTNILVIGFFSDSSDQSTGRGGFRIAYQFIDDQNYNAGTPAPSNVCGQTIRTRPSGILLSPTYPGMYPDKIFCFYKINGAPGQRIKLTFLDIDLYSGGDHCPFDFIKIYDGPTNEYPVIDVYCGTMQNVQVFSTNESLHIEFVTKSGRAEATKKAYLTYDEKAETDVQRRGFNSTFQISDAFFNLDYIQGHHVRGTECDQVIFSEGETYGNVTSPYYPRPYPLNITCIYYIDGLQDKRNLEKVELEMEDVDIPNDGIGCSNGYLRAFLKGQDPKPDATDFDQQYCGSAVTVPKLTTIKPRLLLVFSANGVRSGRGFKAKYRFVTDYAIEGTPATSSQSQCHYIYRSTSSKHGTFTSPRHPSYYPDKTHCIYEFLGEPNEQVRITFENFRLENGQPHCNKDHVQVFNVVPHRPDVLIGKYCGDKLPGPQMSEEHSSSLKVVLTTNENEVRQGFRARYEFVEKTEEKRCVYNITSLSGGVITSPNFPFKYYTNRTCDWYINSRRKDGIILLVFDMFEMEGNPETTGCGNAALKIYTNSFGRPTSELCGNNKSLAGWTVQSETNLLHIKFISSAKAVGGKGFTMSWTDIISGPRKGGRCSGFFCKRSHFCISSELKCNKQKNCGYGDDSDEPEECGRSYRPQSALNIILGVVMTLIAVVIVIVVVVHRRRKLRQEKKKKEIDVRYMTRSASEEREGTGVGSGTGTRTGSRDGISINSGQNLFKEQTEKVSIV